jgi:hypothetical protein
MPTEAVLQERAKLALRQGKKAWTFIFDPKNDPLPEHFDQSVKALIFTGAEPTDIVAGITISAMRRSCTDHWAYACGVIRSTVAARLTS